MGGLSLRVEMTGVFKTRTPLFRSKIARLGFARKILLLFCAFRSAAEKRGGPCRNSNIFGHVSIVFLKVKEKEQACHTCTKKLYLIQFQTFYLQSFTAPFLRDFLLQ